MVLFYCVLIHSHCRFEDVDAVDIMRFMLPDIIILITSILSFLLLMFIALSQMWKASNSEQASLNQQQKRPSKDAGFVSSYHSINSEPSQKFSEASVDMRTHSEKKMRRTQSHFVLQSTSSTYFVTTWNFTFIFLLWLSGVCTASVLNFPYFITSLCLALCWALHLNRTRCFLITQRIIIILITLYSFIHLILLYVYQLQSAQDLVSRSSVTARCVCVCVCVSVCVCMYACTLCVSAGVPYNVTHSTKRSLIAFPNC